jgi:exopolysaccharide production protein ExoQ
MLRSRTAWTLPEKICTVAMLFYATGAPMRLIAGKADLSSQPPETPTELAVKAALYSLAFCFIAGRWRDVIRSARNAKWVLALVAIAVASVAWSQNPSLTLRASASLLATTAFGLYLGTRYTVPQQLRLLGWTCFLVVSSSLFVAVFFPGYGIDPNKQGAWRGLFGWNNTLARIMVLAVVVFLFVRTRTHRSLPWLGIAASLVLLLLSRSVTGMIVCAAMVGTFLLYTLVGPRDPILIPLVVVGLAAAGLLLFPNFTVAGALELVGRKPDLTGRTELWSAALVSISKRPSLGYGFSAFWPVKGEESGSLLLTAGWPVTFGHNGFVDLALDLGALGLVTFAVGYVIFWRRALAFLVREPGPTAGWLCTYLMFMLLYNLTESSLLAQHTIFWVLYTSAAVSLSSAPPLRLGLCPNGEL